MASEEPNWVLQLREELNGLPPDYQSVRNHLAECRTMFHTELARCFEKVINREISTRPKTSYTDKQALCSWIGSETRELGLSPVSPKSGNPASLFAGFRDDQESSSRFSFVERVGGRTRHTVVHEITPIKLCPDPIRRERSSTRNDSGPEVPGID